MGLLSRLFKSKKESSPKSEPQSEIYTVNNEHQLMNWAIEKAGYTLHYFEDSLADPKPYQQYFSIKVKIVDGEAVEHLWLVEPSFDSEGHLYGIVGNNPQFVSTVKANQKIGISRELISDWMIIEHGRLIGGYTIRAIRDGLSDSDLSEFDKSLGGIYVDEGEDHFLPNLHSPEGAILLLESAYSENNIEKALSCKDFTIEAELMLKNINNELADIHLIEKTAEMLRQSFIKSLEDGGMPDFSHIKRAFPVREKIAEYHFLITEVCIYPDGSKSKQKLNTYYTDAGWKVLSPE